MGDPQAWGSTWILIGASQRTEACLDNYRSRVGHIHLANPFELHLLFINIAMAAWRPYFSDLLEEVGRLVRTTLVSG
jgi:hypothetical protein